MFVFFFFWSFSTLTAFAKGTTDLVLCCYRGRHHSAHPQVKRVGSRDFAAERKKLKSVFTPPEKHSLKPRTLKGCNGLCVYWRCRIAAVAGGGEGHGYSGAADSNQSHALSWVYFTVPNL